MTPRTRTPRWTPAELATLTREWHLVGEATLREKLGGRSWAAIRDKAYHLGLPQGVPQGHESIAAACRRTGYMAAALRRILDDHQVPVRRVYRASSRRLLRGSPRARYYVETDAVDDAVARRLELETVNSAARTRGVNGGALYKRLAALGLLSQDSCKGPGSAHRLPSVVIDAALVGYRHRPRTVLSPPQNVA